MRSSLQNLFSNSPTCAVLTNNNFLSSLKRHRAVRNRSNNVTPTPSKHTNRLPILPERPEDEEMPVRFTGGDFSCSLPPLPPPRSTSPKEKRRSRYGKGRFAVRDASTVTDECPGSSAQPRIASRDPSSSIKQMRRSVRLSAFDIILDIPTSEPASPVSETSSVPYTSPCPRGQRTSPLNRTRSPTPSLTSMSACSSTDMPTTPGSDDEWPTPPTSRKTVARPPISTHPFAVSKSTPSPVISEPSTVDSVEFTLDSFFSLGPEDEETEEQEEDEDDVLWYSRELGEVVDLCLPDVPSNGPARPESLYSLPRSSRRCSNRLPARSRMSKPLPDLPRTPGPSSQMDPTFPRFKSRPPPVPLPPSPNAATHPSHLSPPAPAATPEPRGLPVPLASTPSPTSVRRPLSIVVPRALPRTSVPLDVSDILDDIDAWSFATPSTGTQTLSPPRIPSSASSSPFSSEYDPFELIVSYASRPASPSSTTPTYACAPGTASFLEEGDELDWAADGEGEQRSRWSCSTLATLAASGSSPTTPTTTSERLRMHLGTVARLVRARRVGRSKDCEDPVAVPKAAMHVRSASESAMPDSVTVYEEAPRSGLQRKPIPPELFSRSSQKSF